MKEELKSLLWALLGGNSIHFDGFKDFSKGQAKFALVVRWWGPWQPLANEAIEIVRRMNDDGWTVIAAERSFRSRT